MKSVPRRDEQLLLDDSLDPFFGDAGLHELV
jgi:hypothetical protein